MVCLCSMTSGASSRETQRLGVTWQLEAGLVGRLIHSHVWHLSWKDSKIRQERPQAAPSMWLAFLIVWWLQGSQTLMWQLRVPSTSTPMNKVDYMAAYDPELTVTGQWTTTKWQSRAHQFEGRGVRSHLLTEDRQDCVVEGHVGCEILSWPSLVNTVCHGYYYFCSIKLWTSLSLLSNSPVVSWIQQRVWFLGTALQCLLAPLLTQL